MRRLKVAGAIIGLVMAFAGIKEMGLAFSHGKQVEMSLGEYLSERPEGRWVKLTDCRVAYSSLVYIERVGKTSTRLDEVSVPVYATNQSGSAVKVILVVNSSRAKEVVKNPDAKGVRRETIEGVIRDSGTFNTKLQKIAKWKPAADCVIIDEGRKPSAGKALAMLGLGGGVLGLLTVSVMRRVASV